MLLARDFPIRKYVCVAAVQVLCSGCFGYVTAERGTVPPGERVRVHLTQEGPDDLAEFAPGLTMDGTLVRADSDQLILRVSVVDQTVGIMTRSLGQDLTIPASRIARLEQRELDRRRTWLTAGVGAAVVAAMLTSFGEGVPNPELPPVEEDPAGFTAWRAAISLFKIPAR
ncbi:MAG: hypothetical protein OXR82_16115 [Gammaproteobacteria bacterium]|nr:hypothetical protein [Gammaproteobacteria bacterium]MDE0259897.1 hypothetical protein [Gammaproteobacteria bacterium]